MQILILPGYGNSGPDHWQSHWEKAHPEFARVNQKDWENPKREDWLLAIDTAIAASTMPVILVAHSLACLAIAHWGQNGISKGQPENETFIQKALASRKKLQGKVHAALLVAPPDPHGPVYPPEAADFGPIPKGQLVFRNTLVYSADDPYATESFSMQCARDWHSEALFVGKLGHINSASRLEMWPQGMAILKTLWP
jgi:uncharacterized protein